MNFHAKAVLPQIPTGSYTALNCTPHQPGIQRMITRRRLLQSCLALPALTAFPAFGQEDDTLNIASLKAGYAQRLKKILSTGVVPYIDIESSCSPDRVDIGDIARSMDQLNIGLMALSSDLRRNQFVRRIHYDNFPQRLLAKHADRFIPIGNGGQPPALTEAAEEFLNAQESAANRKAILMFGEYELRHYPSPRQVQRGDSDRDVDVPMDNPTGHRLFSMSEKTGLSFQIHYEIEDTYLLVLEKMLAQYPKARVIWCHLAQVRYSERAARYSATYVDELIRRFPNLYFDTAFGHADSVYPVSGQRHARVWAGSNSLRPEWLDLIVTHSERFLSALDLGQDRLHRITEFDQKHRQFLSLLPENTRHRVAYRNTWKLLFNEEFS